jgi:hypothetical protein
MSLSPLSKYYLRKFLQEYWHELHWLEHQQVSSHTLSIDPRSLEQTGAIDELETLVQVYCELEKNPVGNYANLAEIKRRLLFLLGLRLKSLMPSTAILTIEESAYLRFYFLQNQQTQEGIRYGNRLYGLVQSFPVEQRFQAYRLAWALSEQKIPSLLTVSEARYVVWVCMRSPTYALLFHKGKETLRSALFIYAILCRSKSVILAQGSLRSAA